MIILAEATKAAERYIQDMERACGMPLRLLKDQTIERSFGWAFFYDAALPTGSGDADAVLAGNAPIIVDKRDGSLHETGTAYLIEQYLDNYERTGTPHSE
jgi:Immunity protein 35